MDAVRSLTYLALFLFTLNAAPLMLTLHANLGKGFTGAWAPALGFTLTF